MQVCSRCTKTGYNSDVGCAWAWAAWHLQTQKNDAFRVLGREKEDEEAQQTASLSHRIIDWESLLGREESTETSKSSKVRVITIFTFSLVLALDVHTPRPD